MWLLEYADLPSPGCNESCATVCPKPDYWPGKFLFGLKGAGGSMLGHHSATHMQPTKLTMLGNKFTLPRSAAEYIWIYSTYATMTGANTMLAMGEILVKRCFSGIAEAIPQLRIDFRPRLV